MLRQRRKPVAQIVESLDAFPKVPETIIEQTASGATVAILTFVVVVVMLYSELSYFYRPGLKFRFSPDADLEAKLKINVDITVAMQCSC